MRKTCLDAVYELAKKDPRVVFIGSDLGVDTLKQFKKEMPDRFLMEGISEANIVGVASGLALEGKIPYVNTMSTFLMRRACEQVILDMCLHNVNVRLLGNGGGFVYAPLGPTHMAIEDIAIARAIPNLTILAPCDADEMQRLMNQTAEYQGPIFVRIAKGNDPIVSSADAECKIGKPILARKGKDALIVTTGITLKLALEASDYFNKVGVDVSVLHLHTLKPFDTKTVFEMIASVPAVVTIEEHTLMGGLGSAVAEVIAEAGFTPGKRFRRIGIPDLFPDEYGSQASLMKRFSITTENLISTLTDLMKSNKDAQKWNSLNL